MAEQTMPEWRAYTTESACPMSEERHSFVHGERVVYQWTQSLRYAGIAIPNLVGRILNFHRHPVFLTCLTITTPSRAYIYVRRSEVNVFIPEVARGRLRQGLEDHDSTRACRRATPRPYVSRPLSLAHHQSEREHLDVRRRGARDPHLAGEGRGVDGLGLRVCRTSAGGRGWRGPEAVDAGALSRGASRV